jgi:putative serine protease PepD
VQTHGLGPRSGPDFRRPEGSANGSAAVPEALRRPTASAPGPSTPSRSSSIPRLLAAGLLAVGVAAGAGALAGQYAGDPAGVAIPQPPRPGPSTPGDLVAVADQVRQGVVSVRAGNASGTGFLIDDQGHILTNHHILEAGSASSVSVTGPDGRRLPATVVGSDPEHDLAVLRIEPGAALRALPFGSSAAVRVGEQVLAVGSPLGLSGTVTSGIVSAVDRSVRIGGSRQPAMQTDASINPGNSGGPLVNARGEVIGVNTAIATFEGGGSIGIGFAIPIDRAASVANELIR